MPRILVIVSLILLSSFSRAQFIRADYRKAEAIFHRPLAIALFDVSRSENPCDSAYKAWYNGVIREVLPPLWQLNDTVIFMESRTINSIMASRDNDYAVFSAGMTFEGQQSAGDIFWFRSFTFMLFLSEDGKKLESEMVNRSSPLITDMESGGQLLRGRYIFKISFAGQALSVNDLRFAIHQFNSRVNLALEKQYPKKGIYADKIPNTLTASLKQKTLLIPFDLDEEQDHENISAVYRYPFRIASHEEIETAIASRAEGMAYLHYLWSDREHMFLGAVIDCQSAEVLAFLKPNAARLQDHDCLPPGTSYRTMLRMKAGKLKGLERMIR